MIEVDNVMKSYSRAGNAVDVLRGVSFRIERGEFVALMGTSGSGKSTLLNLLGALDRPSSGAYRLDGEEVSALDDDARSRLRNRKIGFVFQQFHLLERAPAWRNVTLPLVYADVPWSQARGRAVKALEAVGLSDRVEHRPGELSGGQQQRVAIARALVTEPAFLLADEPTGNLDRDNARDILALFRTLHGAGRTILMVTHDAEVAAHADRVLVLRDGRNAEDRPAAATKA